MCIVQCATSGIKRFLPTPGHATQTTYSSPSSSFVTGVLQVACSSSPEDLPRCWCFSASRSTSSPLNNLSRNSFLNAFSSTPPHRLRHVVERLTELLGALDELVGEYLAEIREKLFNLLVGYWGRRVDVRGRWLLRLRVSMA